MPTQHPILRCVTTLGLATAVSATATADFVTRFYSSGSNYNLQMSHMPDFDQRRAGLPLDDEGEPGGMWCVPTAVSNLFAYTALHGYPGCAPGVDAWDTNSGNHGVGTNFIFRVGSEMRTHATRGTSHGRKWRGTRDIKNDELGSRFVVTQENRSRWDPVTLREMAIAGIHNREIQALGYGRYEIIGRNACDERVIFRRGGHCMTLVGAQRSGSSRSITYHNPTGDSIYTSDSSVNTVTNACPWISDLVVSRWVLGSCALPKEAMNRARPSSDSFLRLLDSRVGLRPASGHSWRSFDSGRHARGGAIVESIDLVWEETHEGGDRTYESAAMTDGNVTHGRLVLSPNGFRAFLDRSGQGSTLLIEDLEADSRLVPAPLHHLDLPPIDDVAYSTDHTLVLQCGNRLIALAGLDSGLPTDEDPAAFVAWESEVPFPIGKIVSLGWGSGWNWEEDGVEPTRHSILAISADGTLAAECWGTQTDEPTVRPLPQALGLDPQRLADTWAQVDSKGTVWFATAGRTTVRGMIPSTPDPSAMNSYGPGSPVVQHDLGIERIEGLAIDDLDHLLVSDAGLVRCFKLGPNGIGEVGREASAFAGEIVGRDFVVDRSSTNHDSTYHTAENGWYDIVDPDSCPGDFDGDGRVDGADFGTLLGTWGFCEDCPTDLDGDGKVDGADMGLLLGFWGDCGTNP